MIPKWATNTTYVWDIIFCILFLTKTQIQKIEKASEKREIVDIKLSYSQMKKTCKFVILLNKGIEWLTKEIIKEKKKKIRK